MRTQAICAAVSALAAVTALGASAARAIDPAPADVATQRAAGRQLYVRQGCYLCHGLAGQGSVLTGPSLSPLRLSSSAFHAYVRNPKGAMPPFTAHILPEPDLARIEAYVRAFPEPAPYTSIPLLNAVVNRGPRGSGEAIAGKPVRSTEDRLGRGRLVYAQSCARCHGASREGVVGPALGGEARKRSLDETMRLIMKPPGIMPKLYPDPLSQADVRAVAVYVRSPAGA